MRGIGQGVREFNSAKSNLKQEIEEGMKKDNTAAPKAKETEETKA
jgi:sec-independent protein translocase protein TatA